MPTNLKGKPILITGASSGIGRATALACARAGMPVFVTARRDDRLRALVDEVRAAGGAAEHVALDVRDEAACARAADAARTAFGPVYAVFANAGFGFEAPTHAVSDAEAREIFDVNYFGTLNIIRPLAPRMVEAGAGHILICSSCLATLPTARYAHYSATKAAQHHVGRAMGAELRPFGVRVTTVHPVGTRTEFFDESARRSPDRRLTARVRDALMQPAERVARAVVGALRRPKPEVWLRQSARLSFATMALLPRTTERLLARSVRRAAASLSSFRSPT